VSRIDSLIDTLLEKQSGALVEKARGQVAVASAKLAYQIYKEIFGTVRFQHLLEIGARGQRPLWASTGTKNPDYSDVKYVEALIGPDTVNTVPLETLIAYHDHGHPEARLEKDTGAAARLLKRLPELGIDLDKITQQLENEGVTKFNKPFDKLMDALARKIPGS
jgi:transaldolase